MQENNEENTNVKMTKEELAQKVLNDEVAFYAQESVKYRKTLEQEKDFPWLSGLMETYGLIDSAVAHLINTSKEKDSACACREGCTYCCYQQIPISPLEGIGLFFAVHFYLTGEMKERVHAQMKIQNAKPRWNKGCCPFLIDGSCSIYVIRPIVCRNFLAFNDACIPLANSIILYQNTRKNFKVPSGIALQFAYAHMSGVCATLGIIEEGKMLNFDTAKELFADTRTIPWLKENYYTQFFKEKLAEKKLLEEKLLQEKLAKEQELATNNSKEDNLSKENILKKLLEQKTNQNSENKSENKLEDKSEDKLSEDSLSKEKILEKLLAQKTNKDSAENLSAENTTEDNLSKENILKKLMEQTSNQKE